MNNLTDNKNMLQPGNFKVSIDSYEFANLQFFCTNITLPTFMKNAASENFRGTTGYFPGDQFEFEPMDITFIIDEDMKNYEEVYNWIATGDENNPKYKDITLSILSNRNTTNRQIRFHSAFPTSLGSIEFTTSETDTQYITCTCSFRFDYFSFDR